MPTFHLSLTNWTSQNRLLASGTILGALAGSLLYWATTLEQNGPVMGVEQSIPWVMGYACCIVATVLLLFGFVALYMHLFECNGITFDEHGLSVRYLWRRERFVSWDSQPKVQILKFPKISEDLYGRDFLLIFGGVGKLIYLLITPPSKEFYHKLCIDSPRFQCEEGIDNPIAEALSEWCNLREIASMVAFFKGTITWQDETIVALSLAGTTITDREFTYLANDLSRLPRLAYLNLNQSLVTEKILPDLLRIESLQEVQIFGSNFSVAQMRLLWEHRSADDRQDSTNA